MERQEVERSALSVMDLEEAIVAAAAGSRAGTDDGEASLGGDTSVAFKEDDFFRSIGPPSVVRAEMPFFTLSHPYQSSS